jgi:type IV secretion system protein VirD4
LPLDEIVVVVDAQMPVRAKRVVYFEDPFFKKIHGAQAGELPFPQIPKNPDHGSAASLSQKAKRNEPVGNGENVKVGAVTHGLTTQKGQQPRHRKTDDRVARAWVLAEDQRQFEMDFSNQADLSVDTPSTSEVAQVEKALDDLEKLEKQMMSPARSEMTSFSLSGR